MWALFPLTQCFLFKPIKYVFFKSTTQICIPPKKAPATPFLHFSTRLHIHDGWLLPSWSHLPCARVHVDVCRPFAHKYPYTYILCVNCALPAKLRE